MAKKNESNGNGSLAEATRQLEIAVASILQTQASVLGQMSEYQRDTAQRFARIEASLAELIHVLNQHTRSFSTTTLVSSNISPRQCATRFGFEQQS